MERNGHVWWHGLWRPIGYMAKFVVLLAYCFCRHHAWEKFYRYYLENAYINNLQIFHREITKDAELRYKELLNRNPEVVRRLSNKVVASYLNMSPETLSRMK